MICFLFLFASTIQALYTSKDNVVLLTPKNFKSTIMETMSPAIVEFFAPWCGHCKNLAPEYKLAANKLAGMVTVGAVDCDADENKSLCATYGIQGFPTIKTFSAGIKGMPMDYQGPRTAAAIVKEGISKVKSFLKKCEAKGFDDFVSSNDKAVLTLISEKDQVPVMFKALSAEFYDQVDLCYFKSTDTEIVKKAGVSTFPALIIFSKDKEPIVYDGPQKFKHIKEYVEPFAIKRKKGSEKKKEVPKKKPVFDPKVLEVSNQSQLDECLGKVGICLISFITLEPEYQESVDAHTETLSTLAAVKKMFYDLDAPFTFVWVNSITHGRKLIKDFDISDIFPSFIAINGNKRVYQNLRSAFDKDSISGFLNNLLAGKGQNIKYNLEPKLDQESHTEL